MRNNNVTIETQYNSLLRENRSTNESTYPNGFWKSRSRRGVDLGLGFYCEACKLTILDGAGTVRHCRREVKPPTGWWARLRLKTFRIKS